MRDIFPAWYLPNGSDLDKTWTSAWIVLDASVLLNLYKYPEQARRDLLLALDQVKDRIWLPYQSAMEFQRNRTTVIADQLKKFSDAQRVVTEFRNKLTSELGHLQLAKRHSLINPEPLLLGVGKLVDEFLVELNELEKKQLRVNSLDETRARLDNLLEAKIGDPPVNQEALDLLEIEAQQRFDSGRPPGFKDEGTKGESSYECNGLRYVNKYGDFLFWNQFLAHIAAQENKSAILVTDDEKSDWWNVVESKGKIRLGPSIALGEEFARVSGGGDLVFYTSETFLNEARSRFNLDVSQDSIDQVRDIAEAEPERYTPATVERTFFHWLRFRHGGQWVDRRQFFPDFIVGEVTDKVGYDLKFLRRPLAFHLYPILESAFGRASQYMKAGAFDRFILAIVVTSEEAAAAVLEGCKASSGKISGGFPVEIYTISQDEVEEHPTVRLFETVDHGTLGNIEGHEKPEP